MKTQAELKAQWEAKRADQQWNAEIEMLCYDLTRLARAISGPIKRAKRPPTDTELRLQHMRHERRAAELRYQERHGNQ